MKAVRAWVNSIAHKQSAGAFAAACVLGLLSFSIGLPAFLFTSSFNFGAWWAGAGLMTSGVLGVLEARTPRSKGWALYTLLLLVSVITAVLCASAMVNDGLGVSRFLNYDKCYRMSKTQDPRFLSCPSHPYPSQVDLCCCDLSDGGSFGDQGFCMPVEANDDSDNCFCCKHTDGTVDGRWFNDVHSGCGEIVTTYRHMVITVMVFNVGGLVAMVVAHYLLQKGRPKQYGHTDPAGSKSSAKVEPK